jgi:uncharacterized Tic20 family protein
MRSIATEHIRAKIANLQSVHFTNIDRFYRSMIGTARNWCLIMKNLIPFEFRILAVLFYAIGSIPMVLVIEHVITSHLNLYDFGIGDYINDHLYRSITVVSIITLIAILILWGATRQIHPFIDGSGRDAIERTMSSVISTAGSWLVFIYCPFLDWIGNNNRLGFIVFAMQFTICIAIANLLVFTIAIVFSLQGYRFTDFLIYPFI